MQCSTASQVDSLCEGLASSDPRTKYGSAKELRRLAEQDPDLLYPRFDFFLHVMQGDSRILRWNASRILAHLAPADSHGRIDELLDRYLAPIEGPELIAAASVIQGAVDIACAKPHLADRIARALLKVSRARYATPECRNIATGHAIQSLDGFFEHVQRRAPVLNFVADALLSPRPATRKKAEKFLKKWRPKLT